MADKTWNVIQFIPGHLCYDLQPFTSKLPVINTKAKGTKSEYFLHMVCKTPAAESVQAAVAEFHRPCGLDSRNLILTVLDVDKPKNKAPSDLLSGESRFLVQAQWSSPICPLRWKRWWVAGPSDRGSNPVKRALNLWPRPHLQTSAH